MVENDIFIGRQPIFDRNGKCVSYELLYRHSDGAAGAAVSDNAKATARVIINLVHNIGLSSILGEKIGFINVNEQILMSDVLLSLPKSKFIFEILEHTALSDELVERVGHLHDLGYRFAIDDFCCTHGMMEYFRPLFPYVDILKVDLLEHHDVPIEAIGERLGAYPFTLLAEKVEDTLMFERCKAAGFDLFQGYFFEKPSVLVGKKIEPSVVHAIDMINTLYTESDMEVVSQKFSLYPELTFNLLRYVNSAQFSFRHTITSIKQILLLLGPARLRSWLGLFLYEGVPEGMFREAIIEAAKFRARMMRELVIAQGHPRLADEAFLAGSLSLIDTYLHIGMDEIIGRIHLDKPIVDALLIREGYLGKLLKIAEKLETTENLQTVIENLAPKLNITAEKLYGIYCEASKTESEEAKGDEAR